MPSPHKPTARTSSEYAADPEMAELVEFFISELPGRMAALDAAWNGKKVKDLTRLAHQLKGASPGYGFPSIGSAAGALEAGLTALEPEESAVERLAKEYRALVELCDRACRRG